MNNTSEESTEMTLKDSHSTSYSNTFNSGKLVSILSPYDVILVLYIYRNRPVKHISQYFLILQS